MDNLTATAYVVANQKYFPSNKIIYLKSKLETATEEKMALLSTVELNCPTNLFFVSFFFGTLGIDRFILGNIGLGIFKLLTLGCCHILTIIDWFTIINRTKEDNFKRVMAVL